MQMFSLICCFIHILPAHMKLLLSVFSCFTFYSFILLFCVSSYSSCLLEIFLIPGKPKHSLKKFLILMTLCDLYYLPLYRSVAISESRNRGVYLFLALLDLEVLLH